MCFSPLAKLGDTQELEEFIADLDKALEGTCPALIPALPTGWGSCTAPDMAQPGQHLLCLGVPLQGAWNLIVASTFSFGEGLMDVTSLFKLFQLREKFHGLSVFPPCCLSSLR